MPAGSKIPISALVLVHTTDLRVLLIERADFPDHWQSVTGSQEPGEPLAATAARELLEETGIDAELYGGVVDWGITNRYEIFPQWRHRYPPGTSHNTEHVYRLELPDAVEVTLAPGEHLRYAWLPWQQAAEKVFSWSNRHAIEQLPLLQSKRSATELTRDDAGSDCTDSKATTAPPRRR